MPLSKSKDIIEQLGKIDEYFKSASVLCWQRPAGHMQIHIFSVVYNTVNDLKTQYLELRDHVAISFQSQKLQSEAERWNLYLFFIVREVVPEDVKQLIVQDKFSTRKVISVFTGEEITEEIIGALIEKELFEVTVRTRQPASGSLSEAMTTTHPLVAKALKDLPDNSPLLQPLLNILTHEQDQENRDQ